MQIPVLESSKINERNLYVPCSYNDYLLASQGKCPKGGGRPFKKLINFKLEVLAFSQKKKIVILAKY